MKTEELLITERAKKLGLALEHRGWSVFESGLPWCAKCACCKSVGDKFCSECGNLLTPCDSSSFEIAELESALREAGI